MRRSASAAKKAPRALAALALLVGVVIVAGCGKKEQEKGATPSVAPVEASNAAARPQVAPN